MAGIRGTLATGKLADPSAGASCSIFQVMDEGRRLSPGGDAAAAQSSVPAPRVELLEEHHGLSRLRFELRRHAGWAQREGVGRLIEEDQLDPVDRVRNAARKGVWRVTSGVHAGMATPAFLVGVQRSGTNMVVRGLESSPAVEVHNENDRAAFDRYELRDIATVRRIVQRSRARVVLFKPLCDSHRTVELLEDLGSAMPPRAIWAFRSYEQRVRSALAKFGANNLQILADIAAGEGMHRWQARGISEDTMALIRSFDWTSMDPASAAALFWYVRNQLFFDQGLQHRPDVVAVSYDRLVTDPRLVLEPVVNVLGLRWDDRFIAHIDTRARTRTPQPLDIHARVRQVCDTLQARLEAVVDEHLARAIPVAPVAESS